MNRSSTLFLKFVIFSIAIAALAVCIIVLPQMTAKDASAHPELAYQQYPFLAYAYTLCLVFFVALYQSFRLLNNIDANNAFSELSVRALRNIKYCAFTICALIGAGILTLMVLASGKGEDITGIVMPGLIVTFIACVGAACVTILQRHVQKAIEMKSENDFTV
jgi:hypothetical protein